MTARRGFQLDLAGCTGCKACQMACKDKHDLGEGVLWRKVVAVEAGTDAYFVSVACMHCDAPICVEVCPTKAMRQREDGVVFIESTRCIGCGYCAWACPYAAPQYDAAAGVMTKCDLCRDHLELGRPPACVEACPMRVLTLDALPEADDGTRSTFPLPPAALTRPRTSLLPHRDVGHAARSDPRIANEEEL